jgi:polysaccharide export outer membrane protein
MIAVLALLLVSACASSPSGQAAMAGASPAYPPPAYADWTSADYRYRLAPGDELSLRFLFNPDLNTQVIVGPDGRGVFPLISAVKVEGLTVEEANAALMNAYASTLRQPTVEALVTSYGAAQIYVGGEVREPGVHPIKGQLTVAQAVMTAGGFANTARTGKVAVIRQRPGDPRLLMRVVDVKDLLANGDNPDGFAVLPGDLVFVPRSKIAEVDLFVQQYIVSALPFSTGVSYSAGNAITR